MSWLGVDIGTTHTKAVVLDDAGQVSAAAAVKTATNADGWSRDPAAVLADALAVCRQVVRDSVGDIGGIAIASVGEEIVPIGADGKPSAPTIVWYDVRGTREAEAFAPTALHRKLRPDPTFSIFKLLWLSGNGYVPARSAMWLDLSAFVLKQLGAPATMDWSHASRTGVFDPVSCRWDEETIKAAGFPQASFPDLVPSGEVIGALSAEAARSLQLPPGIPLVSGGHDHFVGAFASGVREEGDGFLSAGTSEAQLVLTATFVDQTGSSEPLDQGRFVDRGHWYLHRATPCGQLHLQWQHLLYEAVQPDRMAAEVQAASTAPSLRVELDPSTRRVNVIGLPLDARRDVTMRAIEEGAAIASLRAHRTLERAYGHPVGRIVLAGHPTDDPLWLSLRLGLLRRRVHVAAQQEAAAFGAALIARQGVLGSPSPSIPSRSMSPTSRDIEVADELKARYNVETEVGSGNSEEAS